MLPGVVYKSRSDIGRDVQSRELDTRGYAEWIPHDVEMPRLVARRYHIRRLEPPTLVLHAGGELGRYPSAEVGADERFGASEVVLAPEGRSNEHSPSARGSDKPIVFPPEGFPGIVEPTLRDRLAERVIVACWRVEFVAVGRRMVGRSRDPGQPD